MPSLGTIIYTGSFQFPEGDAAAARVLGIGKALRAIGYEVVFAGGERTGREEDRRSDGTFVYQGFSYFPQDEFRNVSISGVHRLLRYAQEGTHTYQWLQTLDTRSIRAIVIYNSSSGFFYRVLSFCRAHRLPLFIDCTEWYEPSHLVGGRYGPVRWDNEMRMRLLNPLANGVIAISSYLKEYYQRKSCLTLQIPPLVDMEDPKWNLPPSP